MRWLSDETEASVGGGRFGDDPSDHATDDVHAYFGLASVTR